VTDDPKRSLRQRVLARRMALSAEERATRSRAIAARVASLPAFSRARTVALYAAIGAEVDTVELARLAAAGGKQIVWPRIGEGERRLTFAACAPGGLRPGPHGTRVPPPEAPEVPIEVVDLVCVPGVAFDEARRRLGRGGGYYDATLGAAGGRTLRVGLAFECQMVDAVPAAAHDIQVDAVATELRLVGGRGG